MKKTINKISMIAVAVMVFATTLVLNMEKGKNGKWRFISSQVMAATAAASASASAGDTGSGSNSGNLLFEAEHESTVQCQDSRWRKIEYRNESGQLVGTYLIEGGVVKSTYGGSYASSTESSGGVAAHPSTMVQCYGWGWGCTPITATQACQ